MVNCDKRGFGGSLSAVGLGVNQGLAATDLSTFGPVSLQKRPTSMSSDEGRFEA